MKDGGCNHVRCGRCRVEFCWACMRSHTRCQAYRCTNGALFAVRAGLDALERERRAGQTLIERIDQVEALALRNLSFLPYPHASMVSIILAASMAYSSSAILWDCAKRILSLASVNPSFLLVVIFIHSASMPSYNALQRRRNNVRPGIDETRHNPDDIGRGQQEQNATLQFIRTFRQPGLMSEGEQIAEAIIRSLASGDHPNISVGFVPLRRPAGFVPPPTAEFSLSLKLKLCGHIHLPFPQSTSLSLQHD